MGCQNFFLASVSSLPLATRPIAATLLATASARSFVDVEVIAQQRRPQRTGLFAEIYDSDIVRVDKSVFGGRERLKMVRIDASRADTSNVRLRTMVKVRVP